VYIEVGSIILVLTIILCGLNCGYTSKVVSSWHDIAMYLQLSNNVIILIVNGFYPQGMLKLLKDLPP
jgi:hypothetical protein